MKKKVIYVLFCVIFIFNFVFANYKQTQAAALVPVIPEAVSTLISVILGIGVTVGLVDEAYSNYENLSDLEKQQAYEEEQAYMENMKTYMIDGSFGSTQNCSVMTADGSVLTLEEALNSATSMSKDDYINMRKKSSSPTPPPGIDWGSIFIDNAVGGLMDFVADFINNETDKNDGYDRPYTTYHGDSGYIDYSNRHLHGFVECDGIDLSSASKPIKKDKYDFDIDLRGAGVASGYEAKAFPHLRVALLVYTDNEYLPIHYYNSKGGIVSSDLSDHGYSTFDVYCTAFNQVGDVIGVKTLGTSGCPRLSGNWKFDCAFKGGSFLNFSHLSTNLPVFTNGTELKNYLTGGSAVNRVSNTRITTANITCNNYKNKIVTSTSVKSYGVSPTPTPSPTPKPTATPKPTVTPTSTPYPTWDKNSGNGNNFTIYNFYTETSNNFNFIQSTVNNISETITNIYNFFIIDTEKITLELTFDSPAFKFKPFVDTIKTLQSKFDYEEDTYSELYTCESNEEALTIIDSRKKNASALSYPKITMKCPKILEECVDTVDSEGNKTIVIVDFKNYAIWFVRFRGFLSFVLWIGMMFYLLKEFKIYFNVS